MTSYYNEIDPYAAQWLRNLIAAGHIADGVVDERSIEDVLPSDLQGFTQCHFFAGIGVWSYALRTAGWSDDRPVWTGSCPCQPFSDAGKGAGFADERHLWPAFFHLIGHHRPAVVFGEQVASKDAMPWLDLVQDDLEAVGYAFGAIPFPAAGVGAPHMRDRLYWVADASGRGFDRRASTIERETRPSAKPSIGRVSGLVADTHGERTGVQPEAVHARESESGRHGGTSELADAGSSRAGRDSRGAGRAGESSSCARNPDRESEAERPGNAGSVDDTGPTNGFWRAADWLRCRDDRWRPVESGTFPLAHGTPQQVGRLRAYGNGLCAEAARVFVDAYMTEPA